VSGLPKWLDLFEPVGGNRHGAFSARTGWLATTRKETIMATKPTLIAYTVKNRGKDRSAIWTKIGAAW
jgi:hypothetical protein